MRVDDRIRSDSTTRRSFKLQTMSAYTNGLAVLMYCSTLGFVATTVNSNNDLNDSFKTPHFTSRKLHGREPLYDDDAIERFQVNDLIGILRKNEDTTLLCREINVMAHGRLYKLSIPIVYDAMVTDKRTNIRAVVKTCTEEEDAIRWAKEGLINKLFSDGFIDECALKPFSSHMVSTECPSNTKINCSTSCSYQCDKLGFNLIGSSTITCQEGGTLSADQPTCEASKCSIDALPPHLTSNRLQCSQGLDIDYGSSCSFACEHNYSLNGSSILNCLADGTLSGCIPTCTEDDVVSSSSPSHTTQSTRQTKRDSPSPTQGKTTPTTTMTKHHEIPVSSEGTSSLSSSTSLKQETERSDGSQTSSVDTNTHTFTTGYLAFLAIPAIVILVVISFLISFMRKACRYNQYNYLDDRTEIQEDRERWFGVTEGTPNSEDISPDFDGYYRNLYVLSADPTETQLDPQENYDMTSREKGIVFILNNNNFPDGRFRKGSEIDVVNVNHVFQEIGYRPVLYQDLTGNEIRNALVSLVEKIDCCHTSVVLVLMSHGEETGILGVDGNLVTMAEIKDRFSGRNCPALLSKPKIIFVQACRGTTMTKCATDKRSYGSEGVGIMTTDSLFQSATNDFPLEARVGVDTDCNVPDNADMYIAHATSEGYFSMRDRVNGSWFIQALCEELIARVHLDDLDTIMTKVTRRVKNREAKIKVQGQEHRALQTPQTIKQGIGKQIYFLPKYPPTDSEELHFT